MYTAFENMSTDLPLATTSGFCFHMKISRDKIYVHVPSKFVSSSLMVKSKRCFESLHIRSHGMASRGADKSLARPGRKQATTTEDFNFHISYL